MEYVIGKDAESNWKIFEEADENHLWFHLNSFPSCHVIIKSDDPPTEHILEAASLCKFHSKFKNVKNIKIVYTPISNLRLGEVVGSLEIVSKRKCNYVIP